MEEFIMKKIYQYIAIFFVGMAALSSCADDHEIQSMEQKVESATIKLNFQTQSNRKVVNSRATEAENKLYDLHFYVFSAEDESLTGYTKLFSENGNLESPGPAGVEITAKTGESYIYAVANIDKSSTYYLDEDDKALLKVTDVASSSLTLDDFLAIRFHRRYGTEGSELFSPDPVDNVFMMSGYLNDGNPVTIQKDDSGHAATAEGENVIKLYRILAKNTLTIDTNGKFTPKYYRLCNVPVAGALVPQADISDIDAYTADNITDEEVESSYRWNFDGETTISFYYPENLQQAVGTIHGWKDREENDWTGGVKTFTNASADASYIEIHGDYASGNVKATVSYTIHFGDFSDYQYDNFQVIRNHAYTYSVSINGVDDIEVEAKREGDNPYAEGLVVETDGTGVAYDVDAHYEARVMSFTHSSIQALKAVNADKPGYFVNVKTPFGETSETVYVKDNGVYSIGGEFLCSITDASDIFDGEADYKWMKFVRHTAQNMVNRSNDYPCKYPGDDSEEILDVFELLAELYQEETYGNNETVYYTCFVDENYYEDKSWTEYVNQKPRVMLIANNLDVSEDGKSMYAKVAYSVSQRAISTFYTNEYVDAFGTEIIDEEDEYFTSNNEKLNKSKYGTIKSPHDWNAWTSALATNQDGDWYTNTVQKKNIQPLYNTAAKACMSRNRDSDGNGKISEGEVKWYLAAVEQYRALFFGQNALNPDAYLVTRADLEQIDRDFKNGTVSSRDDKGHEYRGQYHYFSASNGNKTIFWPEEGVTTCGVNDSWGYAELVRCIRTLESDGDGRMDPAPYYTFDDNTFDLNGIVATRGYTDEPLMNHNEILTSNNLFSAFVVASEDLQKSRNNYLFTLEEITDSETDPCTKYKEYEGDPYQWRSPNQKEFALMLSEMEDLTDHQYGTRTRFSGDDSHSYENYNYKWTWHDTPGFWSEHGRINVGRNGLESGVRLRCVRDTE